MEKGSITRKLKSLELIDTVNVLEGIEFNTRDFFKTGNNGIVNLYMDKSMEKVLAEASATITPKPVELDKFNLSKNMRNSAIMQELGNPPIQKPDTALGQLKQMISVQPKGDKGNLLVDFRYINVFYVQLKDCVVVLSVRWNIGQWELDCHEFDEDVEINQALSPVVIEG